MFNVRLLFFFVVMLLASISFADESAQENTIAQSTGLKISKEAIASLAMQLSEEKFEFLEKQIIGKEFSSVDLSLLFAQEDLNFSMEERDGIKRSLDLYSEMLKKITTVAPLVSSINDVKLKRDKLKQSLEALMKEEKEAALTEIDVLKVQVQKRR
ncbi:MAG: hypothetical protein D3923_14410 [Candidatus Electrothrix sp. AR3]|nr:hypothetical protein [Candidatus Electrothrix sp. AR3]